MECLPDNYTSWTSPFFVKMSQSIGNNAVLRRTARNLQELNGIAMTKA